MIEIRNLTKSFNPDSFVLENLNCTIKDNAIYGLVGANGAGKSTLLRLINSIYKPNSGSISIDGMALILMIMKNLNKTWFLFLMIYFFILVIL